MPKQRGNGDGSIKKLADGRYRWQVMAGYKDDGSRRVVSGTTELTGREGAEEAKAAIQAAKAAPVVKQNTITMSDWCDKWYKDLYEDVEANKLELSTYTGYKNTLRLIKLQWGNRPVRDISVLELEKGIDQILMPVEKLDENGKPEIEYVRYSMSQYRHIKTMLGQLFNRAAAYKIIPQSENPMNIMKDLRDPEHKKSTKDAYTQTERDRIFESLPDTKWGHAFVVMMAGGFRSQEMVPLRDIDVEPDGSAVNIDKAVKIGPQGKTYLGDPKSEAGERIVYLPEIAWPHAKWLRENAEQGYLFFSDKTKRGRTKRDPDDPIKWMHPDTFRIRIKEVATQVGGIRLLTPHCLRHTFATVGKFEAQLDSDVLMSLTGHSDLKTLNGYTHAQSEVKQKAAKKINEAMQPKKKE